MPRKIKQATRSTEEILEEITKNLPELDYNPDEVECIDAPRAEKYWRSVMDKIAEKGFYQSDEDNLGWVAKNLHRLLNLSLTLKQMSIPVNDYLPCKRMIRIKAFVPAYIYRETHTETVMINGLYAPVEGIMLTPYQSDELKNCKAITREFIEGLGLPYDDYMYGRYKDAVNGCVFVLKKSDLTSYITHSTKWEYFNLVIGVENLMMQSY